MGARYFRLDVQCISHSFFTHFFHCRQPYITILMRRSVMLDLSFRVFAKRKKRNSSVCIKYIYSFSFVLNSFLSIQKIEVSKSRHTTFPPSHFFFMGKPTSRYSLMFSFN